MSALSVSAWSLRRKVALALAIPLLLAGTFGGLRVQNDLVAASNSSASAQQVTALRPAVDYLNAAEEAMVAAVGDDRDASVLKAALADIRRAADQLVQAKESAGLTDEQRYQVDTVLELSQALRAQDAATLSPGTWVAQLRQLHSGVTRLITSIVNEQITPEPRLELLSQALSGRFSLAMQQALAATERTGETGSLELFSEFGVEGAAIDRLAGGMGASEKAVAALRTANAQRFREVRTGGTDLGGTKAYADYDNIISNLQDGIDDELEAAAAEARADALVNAGITLAALVAAVLLALLVSRLLLNPIRRVREGALAVAHERLPEEVARIRDGEEPGDITPIDVTTGEEIGQLARAVEDMHRQAVVLAAGEASLRSQVSQMFITLSRRNTSLVNQQLGLIERLERDEEDPKRLESLFRLDHLAARMRRTADSLLILADAPTATADVEGLTVADALQAATSGVQDYKRVQIGKASQARIDEGAGADLVHLLTELVDNALTYSPPTTTVTVGARTTARGVVVEIEDAGLGIPAEQLAKINETLGSGGEVTPDTARRMGLFVVSRLSQRHGITTSLHVNERGGTTATVALPIAILPDLLPQPTLEPRGSVLGAQAPPAPTTSGFERADEEPRWVPGRSEPVSAEAGQPVGMDLRSRLEAARGLPVRRPAAPPIAPPDATPPPPGTATPPVSPPGRPPSESIGRASDLWSSGLQTPQPGRATEPVASAPEPATAPEPVAERQAASDGLDDPSGPGDEGSDTPIFRSLRSAWLSTGDNAQQWRRSEIEAGWEVADQVADTPATPAFTASGLPQRRPGTRLVPGGVTTAQGATVRDPEAVRARLAAHTNGVSRGRHAAATAEQDPR